MSQPIDHHQDLRYYDSQRSTPGEWVQRHDENQLFQQQSEQTKR